MAQNLTVEKDIERGGEFVDTSIISRKRKYMHCVHSTSCVLGTVLVLTLSVSLAALCVSVLSYQEATSGRQQLLPSAMRGSTVQLVDDEDVEREALKELEVIMEKNEQMQFHLRSKDQAGRAPYRTERGDDQDAYLDAMCNSTASDENEVPLAHIVPNRYPTRGKIPYVGEAHSIITPGWVCSRTDEDSTYYGRVHGGMFFNRTSGFLRLPKDGFYYIYSQVIFRASRRLEEESEIHSKVVVCIPGDQCEFPNSQSKTHLETVDYIETNQFKTQFQAGLFHFPAGTQIAIIASNLLSTTLLNYHAVWYRTYMGAFLVNAAPFAI